MAPQLAAIANVSGHFPVDLSRGPQQLVEPKWTRWDPQFQKFTASKESLATKQEDRHATTIHFKSLVASLCKKPAARLRLLLSWIPRVVSIGCSTCCSAAEALRPHPPGIHTSHFMAAAEPVQRTGTVLVEKRCADDLKGSRVISPRIPYNWFMY